ncbi:HlyD family secretion protein [Klebsiella michiganensis]|uniref:efflux RND transporter periplasmic adaptor subunit n=1 Tax=Klebsiella michiganensis TaxID=1134687 RepID=UPI000D64C266|nr:HlyD family secretion protein [Klebsiella michiganensis]ELB7345673.1 HlyD family secretion protein [Klebsiella michiganensis]ELC2234821.1 HlyD family secretion protein [Klebsiella michiganensis]ELJ6254970.1 HlyD family secretion protein [Klebsiella michiganensis]MDQ2145004.1 HlyD family secretion protein [Klebsiella michiganensis]MDV6972822.1 HlyD family secretion protein [Klebsiella michiganensis]
MKKLKYLSTLLVAALAIIAAWLVWNYYTQSPWTRDGKVRAEQVGVTPQVSGSILELNVRDNQLVKAGDVLFRIDDTPYKIALLNARAQLAKAKAEVARAQAEQKKAASDASRRRHLSQNFISAEDLENANTALNTATTNLEAAKAVVGVAQATLDHAQWQLTQTEIKAPVDGWVTNLSTRVGDYAAVGHPVFALVDSRSFYVVGYFEETKLRNIRPGDSAQIILYSSKQKLQGHVSSIGRAIVDQSVESGGDLVANIKPNIPWVRLAQRVPVRIEFDHLPPDTILVSGTTCTVAIGAQ